MDSDVALKIVDVKEADRSRWTVFFSNGASILVTAKEWADLSPALFRG
ncbi:hypothetical protein AciX9_4362 (plasmid) [Granulicella tundricola MP5ACTX9]|uniref:Uncharacterized protein n=1 Tax=Granulicella tundricola (strain ATCC BAA-1859 / DSM 23138 / MP5ACTX9) TaxID=1198114 RepID=E8X780_GRATM|nr:hypothetical protein AciX9_4362 [Granulicella tundricola MP5ACTX9]